MISAIPKVPNTRGIHTQKGLVLVHYDSDGFGHVILGDVDLLEGKNAIHIGGVSTRGWYSWQDENKLYHICNENNIELSISLSCKSIEILPDGFWSYVSYEDVRYGSGNDQYYIMKGFEVFFTDPDAREGKFYNENLYTWKSWQGHHHIINNGKDLLEGCKAKYVNILWETFESYPIKFNPKKLKDCYIWRCGNNIEHIILDGEEALSEEKKRCIGFLSDRDFWYYDDNKSQWIAIYDYQSKSYEKYPYTSYVHYNYYKFLKGNYSRALPERFKTGPDIPIDINTPWREAKNIK